MEQGLLKIDLLSFQEVIDAIEFHTEELEQFSVCINEAGDALIDGKTKYPFNTQTLYACRDLKDACKILRKCLANLEQCKQGLQDNPSKQSNLENQ